MLENILYIGIPIPNFFWFLGFRSWIYVAALFACYAYLRWFVCELCGSGDTAIRARSYSFARGNRQFDRVMTPFVCQSTFRINLLRAAVYSYSLISLDCASWQPHIGLVISLTFGFLCQQVVINRLGAKWHLQMTVSLGSRFVGELFLWARVLALGRVDFWIGVKNELLLRAFGVGVRWESRKPEPSYYNIEIGPVWREMESGRLWLVWQWWSQKAGCDETQYQGIRIVNDFARLYIKEGCLSESPRAVWCLGNEMVG